MNKRKKILFAVILIFIAYFLAEAASLGIYYLKVHKPFSLSENQSERMAIIDAISRPKAREFGTLAVGNPPGAAFEVLHPYLGFVHDPTRTSGYSEYGFPDSELSIYPKDPNRIIIGVFGGSFAARTSGHAKEVIIKRLKVSRRLVDKEIKVLTVSLAGYKQPQQLMSLAYLLSLGAHFDVIVNLDGFNEVTLPMVENIRKGSFPFYPRNWSARVGELDHLTAGYFRKREALLQERKNWAGIFSSVPFRFSVSANVLWRAYDRVLLRKIYSTDIAVLEHRVPDKATLSYTARGPSFNLTGEEAIYDDLARIWKTASIQMEKLASANGSTYLHFLQPNQYVEGSKSLHKEELKKAYNDEHPYRRSVQLGYPKLIERGKELIQEGVHFYDLTMIFEKHTEPLYVDDCCHVGRAGSIIIASFIAEQIALHLNRN